jgi:glucarate dehydratase
VNGRIRVPDGPGLGVTLDRDKVREYSELYKELGGYPYDRDPGRPEWYALVPNERWADPHDDSRPNMSNRSS